MGQNGLEGVTVLVFNARIQGRRCDVLTEHLVVEKQIQDRSVIRILLNHLSDGPACGVE